MSWAHVLGFALIAAPFIAVSCVILIADGWAGLAFVWGFLAVLMGCIFAGIYLLGGVAWADTPGQVSPYEYRHTPVGEARTHTEARYETKGWHLVTYYDGQGRRHFLRRYPTTQGRLTRAQVEYVGQPGRGHVVGTAWCTRPTVDDAWTCT